MSDTLTMAAAILDLRRDLDAAESSIDMLEPLVEFGEKVLEEVKECVANGGYELEAHVLADIAVGVGLMQFIPYDPKVHGDAGIGGDIGDKIYWWGERATDS